MDEFQLYRPIADHWRSRGFHVATSVRDPGGSRVELDVVAFTPELDDVRIVEAKLDPASGLVPQCVDRWTYAPLVYAAVPAGGGLDLLDRMQDDPEASLGVLEVGAEGVQVLREAQPEPGHREPGKAHVIERRLRSRLAEGKTQGPR